MYSQWVADGEVPQRLWLIAENRPVLLAAAERGDQLFVLAAGAEFLRKAWRELVGVEVLLTDGSGRPVLGRPRTGAVTQAVRTTDQTRMPWILRVQSAAASGGEVSTGREPRLLVAGLILILLVLAGAAYTTHRSVARELAVARLQSDFVAAVSHEFRTPLASVRHLSDMLARGRVGDGPEREQCYQFLSRESSRLERLVEELLDFGRLESGAYRYQFAPVDVAALVQHLIAEFRTDPSAGLHRVELSGEVEGCMVLADRDALARAVLNLLDNAVKYSPDEETIWVTVRRETTSVVVAVRDAGLGIAVGEQQQIFGRFVRGSNARLRQIRGTGVGLAMVRHIMDAHRGAVQVSSRLNEGSTFELRLPADETA
jgi:signal transduction histidine kinase